VVADAFAMNAMALDFDAAGVLAALAPSVRERLGALDVVATIDSTQAELLRRGRAQPDASVLIADTQTAGRGRRGRAWVSPPGANLYLSMFRRVYGGVRAQAGLSLALGVAAADAVRNFGVEAVGLKWPNDLLVHGRKLGGLLVETVGDGDGVIAGIGLNLRMPDDARGEIDQPWIDLHSLGAYRSRGLSLAAAVVTAWLDAFDLFARDGFAAFAQRWDRLDTLAGANGAHRRSRRRPHRHRTRDRSGRGAAGRVRRPHRDRRQRRREPAAGMNLLVDLGNTRLKCARADGVECCRTRRPSCMRVPARTFLAHLRDWLPQAERDRMSVWLASVTDGTLTRRVATGARTRRAPCPSRRHAGAHAEPARGLRAEPQRLGVDRWLAMLAARARGDTPVLVASVGSALTVDAIDAAGQHLGGLIAPTPEAMLESLYARAPHLRSNPGTVQRFASSTEDAVASGALLAGAALIERAYIELAQGLRTPPRLLVSGGGIAPLRPWLPAHEYAPNLVLEGLALRAAAHLDA
jgi:biotin-[acetyl-CoA-carboxylase] ligase BirA-like protein